MNVSAMATLSPRINAEIDRCMELARVAYGREFKRPTVMYRALGRTGGHARVKAWEVTLNSSLLLTATDDVIGQTLPHEIAHLIDFAMHPENFQRTLGRPVFGSGRRRSVHGSTWKAIMALFGKPANRCHDMDTTLAARTVRKLHTYACECGREHMLGPRHHTRVQQLYQVHGITECGIRWKQCAIPINPAKYIGLSKQTQEIIAARNAARR